MFQYVYRGSKFLLVGWIGMIVNSSCLYLFKGILGFPLIPASLMAIEIAIIHNFFWHRHWTWRDRNGDKSQSFSKQLLTYNLMMGSVDLVVNVSILWVLTTVFGVHYLISNIVGMMCGPLIKFWLNEKVVFRKREK
jgi:putative flippase GtrA